MYATTYMCYYFHLSPKLHPISLQLFLTYWAFNTSPIEANVIFHQGRNFLNLCLQKQLQV